jgi:hypothetical protein
MRKNLKESIKEALRRVVLNEQKNLINEDNPILRFDPTNPQYGGLNPEPPFVGPPDPTPILRFDPRDPRYGGISNQYSQYSPPVNTTLPPRPPSLQGYQQPVWSPENKKWVIPGPNGYPYFYWDPSINPVTGQPYGWRPVMS